MKRIYIYITLAFLLLSLNIQSQEHLSDSITTIDKHITEQLMTFPQEKIYIQTDKDGYLSGERIWIRTHLQDALTHKPIFLSRYIYVELLSPVDDLIERIKIRPDSTGAYSGHIDLHDDLIEGSYTIRCYTQYMRNTDESSFPTKVIDIYDPFSLEIEPLIDFEVEKNDISATLQFLDRQSNEIIIPEIVSCNLAFKGAKTLKPSSDKKYKWNVKIDDKVTNSTMLLSLKYKNRMYKRFYSIPIDNDKFNVSFFPEGGYIIPNKTNQIAFKALNASGWSENISGTLYNSQNTEVLKFNSLKNGMGSFTFIPMAEETYYAEVTNSNGTSNRFELPDIRSDVSIVTARIIGKRMMIGILSGDDAKNENLSLLIHNKGQIIYHQQLLPNVDAYTFPVDGFPSGIINLLLINLDNEVLSERLVFIFDKDREMQTKTLTEKDSYTRREHIPINLNVKSTQRGTSGGNIAISVIDKQTAIKDTTANIVSYLLLSSELKGHIESPYSYFNDSRESRLALDALMMTQGWRRYNIPKVIKGEIDVPTEYEPEIAQKIKGKADGLFSSLKEGNISLMATKDSLVSTVTAEADNKGRFEFNVEYPAGTSILVQSLSKKGGKNNLISLEKETFPKILGASLQPKPEIIYNNNKDLDSYLQKANEDYTQQYGIRTIMLDEVTVTAKSLDKYTESTYYSPISATGVRTADDIEKMNVSSFRSLLYTQPGIIVRPDIVTTTRSDRPVLFIIDDMRYEDFSDRLDDIDVSSIESLFVVRDNSMMPGFFPDTDGAIVITTKIGYTPKSSKPINLDHIVPLGYQQYAEFYSPSYETQEEKDSSASDLRTTIYWKPNLVISDNGEASIDFYAADTPTTYLLIAEGVSNEGEIIYFEKEIEVTSSNSR